MMTTGCLQTKLTEPSRSAVEQLLLSTAADRAAEAVPLERFANQKVYFTSNYFEGYDAKYALGTLRDALSQAGAKLVDTKDEADVVVEARSGAMSIDSSSSLLGLPTTAVPIPLTGTFSTPEIALLKSEKQYSIAKLALLAYSPKTGEHFFSSGPMVGKSHNHYYQIFWVIKYTSTDIPEKSRKKSGKPGESGNFAPAPAP